MRGTLACFVVLAGIACDPAPGGTPWHGDGGTTVPSLTVRGRVVNAETCFVSPGCQGVSGVIVAWPGAPDLVRSTPSSAEGAFRLEGIPRGIRLDLLALPQDTAAAGFAATYNPMVAAASAADEVFGLDIYVLPRGSMSLLVGIQNETGIGLDARGGYIGQVAQGHDAVIAATVTVSPAQDPVRFVNVLPRLAMAGEPALLPEGTAATGGFGTFVVPSAGGMRDPVAFIVAKDGLTFDPVVAPLIPGVVTFGVHSVR